MLVRLLQASSEDQPGGLIDCDCFTTSTIPHLTVFWFQSVQQVRNRIVKYPEVTDYYAKKDADLYNFLWASLSKKKILQFHQ